MSSMISNNGWGENIRGENLSDSQIYFFKPYKKTAVMYDHIQNQFDMNKDWMHIFNRDAPAFNPAQPYLRQNSAMCQFPDNPNKYLIAGGLYSNQVHTMTYDP